MFQALFQLNHSKENGNKLEEEPASHVSEINPLEFIDQIVGNISNQITSINDELQDVLAQNNSGLSNTDFADIKGTIGDLATHIHEIRIRATQSHGFIQEMNEDSHKVSLINITLNSNSNSLDKVRKLHVAVEELLNQHLAAEFDHYRETAEQLEEIRSTVSELDPLASIPFMMRVRGKLAAVTDKIGDDIRYAYREIGPLIVNEEAEESNSRPPLDLAALSQTDLVVDAIGPMFRASLLAELVQLQLLPYERLFRPGIPHGTLDQLDRRWAWINRLLLASEEILRDVIPEHWGISRLLYEEFTRRTKKHLLVHLEELGKSPTAKDNTAHVAAIIKALKSCLRFEEEMESRLSTRIKPAFSERSTSSVSSNGQSSLTPLTPPPSSSSYDMSHLISDIFDDYLGPYIAMERHNLEELMIRLEAEDDAHTPIPKNRSKDTMNDNSNNNSTNNLTDGESHIIHLGDPFESSKKMFEYVKASVKRCTAFSRGRALLKLSKELRKVIRQYALNLKERCPAAGPPRVGKSPAYSVSMTEEFELCRIINTAEYCSEVLPQLEELIKSKVNSDLSDEVTFTPQAEAFLDLSVHATMVLVAGICERAEPALRVMRKTNWGAVTSVGDDSAYVSQIRNVIEEAVPRMRDVLSVTHFKNVCLKLATELLTRFQDGVTKQKKIVQAGAEQLLLDVNSIKSMLLRMHHIALLPGETKLVIPPSFISIITTKAKQLEVILKLICTEESILEQRFNIMWPEGQPADLQMILAIKRGMGGGGTPSLIDPLDMAQSFGKAVDKVGDTAKGAVGGFASVGTTAVEGLSSTAFKAVGGLSQVGESLTHVGEKMGGGLSTARNAFGAVGKAGGSAFGGTINAFGGIKKAMGGGVTAPATTSSPATQKDGKF